MIKNKNKFEFLVTEATRDAKKPTLLHKNSAQPTFLKSIAIILQFQWTFAFTRKRKLVKLIKQNSEHPTLWCS